MAIADLVDPSADDPLDSPPHAGQHAALNEAARELDAALAAHEALPHGGGSGGTSDHALLTNVTSDQHHAKAHAISGADHTGTLADAQIPATIARDAEVAGAYVAKVPTGGQVVQQAAGTTPLTVQQAAGAATDQVTVRGSDGVDRIRAVVAPGSTQLIVQTGDATQIRLHAFGAASFPNFVFVRSRSAVIGTPGTIVNNGDAVGTITWQADDGADVATQLALIRAEVDGVPAANDVPGRLVFHTQAKAGAVAERMRIDQAGRVGIGVIPAAGAGKLSVPDGITWPAVNVPSADVNTLDDYQEGTWTPTVAAQTPGDLAVTYTAQQFGRYVKVGRLVTWWIRILPATFTHTTASGFVRVTGLPFTPMTLAGMQWIGAAALRYVKAGYAGMSSYVSSGDGNIYFTVGGSGNNPTLLPITDLPTAVPPQIYASGAYETDL